MRQLQFLRLDDTRVLGFGLTHLSDCEELHHISLPPIPARAVEAANALKIWHDLRLTLAAPDGTPSTRPASVAVIADMPELSRLIIKSLGPLDAVRVANCRRLSLLSLEIDAAEGAGAALHLDSLPSMHDLHLKGAFQQIEGRTELHGVTNLKMCGSITSDTVRAINSCRSLQSLDLEIADLTGDPLPLTELSELPHVQHAQVRLGTSGASWVLRLVGSMPALKRLDLRGQNLTARDLAPLANCTQLNEIFIRGINDPGEPLGFLNFMPELDQCLVLGCPRVGRVRLTAKSGLRRFYFKYGQLEELEIDGAPNLNSIYLGNRAFGYNDFDAVLPRLDISRLTVRNAAELLYLMIDAQGSNITFTEFGLAECPKLRRPQSPRSGIARSTREMSYDRQGHFFAARRLSVVQSDDRCRKPGPAERFRGAAPPCLWRCRTRRHSQGRHSQGRHSQGRHSQRKAF